MLIEIYQDTRGAVETLFLGLIDIFNKFDYHRKCLILDCDTFYTQDILSLYRDVNDNAVFYTTNTEIKPIYSYIKLDEKLNIEQIIEKVKISDNANTGIYCFNNIDELLSQFIIFDTLKLFIK